MQDNLDRFHFRIWCKALKKVMYGNAITTIECAMQYKNDYILMQSTGLKDNNGKLIFEGDIITFTDLSIPFKKASIYFEKGCFYADDKNPVGNVSLGYLVYNKRDVEIIGNIYDNPELLTN